MFFFRLEECRLFLLTLQRYGNNLHDSKLFSWFLPRSIGQQNE